MEVIGKVLATIVEDGVDDDLKYGPHGGFTAILSSPSTDRDGDNLLREEWLDLPDRLPLDVDHGMSVATTVGSFRPYWEGDNMMMEAHFSSLLRAQETRTLVKEGHVGGVSVAFMTDKTKKSGEPRRELLNAGIVAIPSNRDAKILDSKALTMRAEELALDVRYWTPDCDFNYVDGPPDCKDGKKPYGDVEYADPGYQKDGQARYPVNTPEHVRAALSYFGKASNRAPYTPEQVAHINAAIHAAAHKFGIDSSADDKAADGSYVTVRVLPELDYEKLVKEITEAFSVDTKAGAGDAPALTQAIHDAAIHLGAICYPIVDPSMDPNGVADGANKSAKAATEPCDCDCEGCTCPASKSIITDPDGIAYDTDETEIVKTEEIPDDSPLGQWLAQFEKRLTEMLGHKSPVDSPAEAAAASEEEPAPADDAAEETADTVDAIGIARMRLSLLNRL